MYICWVLDIFSSLEIGFDINFVSCFTLIFCGTTSLSFTRFWCHLKKCSAIYSVKTMLYLKLYLWYFPDVRCHYLCLKFWNILLCPYQFVIVSIAHLGNQGCRVRIRIEMELTSFTTTSSVLMPMVTFMDKIVEVFWDYN